jgi:hypothetical protein
MRGTGRSQIAADGTRYKPKLVDGMEYLAMWRRQNPEEYDDVLQQQEEEQIQQQNEAATAEAAR